MPTNERTTNERTTNERTTGERRAQPVGFAASRIRDDGHERRQRRTINDEQCTEVKRNLNNLALQQKGKRPRGFTDDDSWRNDGSEYLAPLKFEYSFVRSSLVRSLSFNSLTYADIENHMDNTSQANHLREFVVNSRHPKTPARGLGGSVLRLLTPFLVNPLNPRNPRMSPKF